MNELELYHHGVKGMKWGVRRSKKQLGRKVSRGLKKAKKSLSETVKKHKAKHAEKAAIAEKNKPKKLSEMSDEELTNRLKRLRMEEEYRRLSPEPSKGTQSFIANFLKKHGTDLANQVASKAVQEIANSVFKKTEAPKKKEVSVLDMSKLNDYSDTEITNAMKRQTNINNLLKNWESNRNTPFADLYGTDSYLGMVSRGEGAVQKALKAMEKRNPSRR